MNGSRCEGRLSGDGGFSLSQCEELMTHLKDKYPDEYKVWRTQCLPCVFYRHVSAVQVYELSSLAVAVAFPQVRVWSCVLTWEDCYPPTN